MTRREDLPWVAEPRVFMTLAYVTVDGTQRRGRSSVRSDFATDGGLLTGLACCDYRPLRLRLVVCPVTTVDLDGRVGLSLPAA